jgi:hypothetical protein
LNADRTTLTKLDTGSGQFDEALEKIGLSPRSSTRNPHLLPGLVSLPIKAMVEQVDAEQIVEATPPSENQADRCNRSLLNFAL